MSAARWNDSRRASSRAKIIKVRKTLLHNDLRKNGWPDSEEF
jgi:hypothetical protein